MKNKLKTHKGITLIALVITIIVLLILSGVAISMISGDNGILKQAARAKETTEDTSILENIQLAELASRMKDGEVNFSILKEELNKTFGENGYSINPDNENPENGWEVEVKGVKYGIDIITLEYLKQTQNPVNKNITLKDEDEYSITIPKNFNVAKESPIKVTEGIIIEDREDNQYVWIPIIEKTEETTWGVDWNNVKNETERSNDYYNAIKTALKEYTKNYGYNTSDLWADQWYGDEGTYYYKDVKTEEQHYYSNGNMTEEQYTKLYHDMLDSVYKNKGFYIGRYEMGIKVVNNLTEVTETARQKMNEYKSSTNNETNQAPSIKNMTAPISKENAVPYTNITQSQAQMLAEKLKEKADYSNVTTSIMFGVEWDATCVFIEHFDPRNTEKTTAWVKTDSTAWGNYRISEFTLDRGFYNTNNGNLSYWNEKSSDISKENGIMWLCTTGASDKNSSLNIYDFAGHLDEFSLESRNGIPCTRGSFFSKSYTGQDFASYRGSTDERMVIQYSYYTSSRLHFFVK